MNFMCRMCSLCCCTCEDETLNVTYSNKSNLINYRWPISQNYTRQLYKHIHVEYQICSTCLLLLLISKILKGLDNYKTTLVDCLFSRDDFDSSVIHTLGNDKSKAVIGGVTIPQTWREHLPENGSWILIGLSRERNVVRFSAAVSGEESSVTTLKTAV